MSNPENTSHTSDTVDGEYEDSVNITCETGYVVVGSAGTLTDNTYLTTCEANGTWSNNTSCQSEYTLLTCIYFHILHFSIYKVQLLSIAVGKIP